LRNSESQIELSIVVPTFNRGPLLARCLAAIALGTACDFEVIVVNGASTDDTATVLDDARAQLGSRLRVIREEQREGFVRAANKGFAMARGRFLTWLNDDARPIAGTYDRAIEQLKHAAPTVGLLALFHRIGTDRNVAYSTSRPGGESFKVMHVRGTLYANFAIGRRDTFARLGGFDERFFLNGADPDLSLKAWQAGLQVVPAFGCLIDHDEHADDRRETDSGRASTDNAALFDKWTTLPARGTSEAEFEPARPCSLRSESVTTDVAA
jgi:N-acetylglucosaminyl-diphospho-decaprenol L-rhamnosyltransferase